MKQSIDVSQAGMAKLLSSIVKIPFRTPMRCNGDEHHVMAWSTLDIFHRWRSARSEGASAAFIEEWIRRAAIFAVERQQGAAGTTALTKEDLNAAIHEIIVTGGNLTRKLLGYKMST